MFADNKINKIDILSLVPLEDDYELRITSIIAKGTGKKKYIPLLLIYRINVNSLFRGVL